MSRVYVMQAARFQADVSPAATYGDIQFVLSPGDRTSSTPELSLKKLVTAMQKFDPDQDYIVWSGGDPLSAILTGAVLAELGVTRFRFLRFEKMRGKDSSSSAGYYVPVEVDFGPTSGLFADDISLPDESLVSNG
jgi:hypothetical protein